MGEISIEIGKQVAFVKQRPAIERIKERITEDGDCWIWDVKTRNPVIYEKQKDGKYKCLVVRKILMGSAARDRYKIYASVCESRWCVNPKHCKGYTRSEFSAVIGSKAPSFKRKTAAMKSKDFKLNYDLADEIRVSDLQAKDAAVKYGVSRRTIHDIRSGRTWQRTNIFTGLFR